jgi:hydrogenase expression/formation protein HypC
MLMCLAVPMQVTEVADGLLARCRVGEGQTYITASLLLLPDPPKVGDYVIVHAGFALHTVTPEEAEESLRLLRQIAAGGDLELGDQDLEKRLP